MLEMFGQFLGIVVVVLGFVSFQMKASRGILALQLATALVFAAHYYFIGALTATALYLLGAVKCAVLSSSVIGLVRNRRPKQTVENG